MIYTIPSPPEESYALAIFNVADPDPVSEVIWIDERDGTAIGELASNAFENENENFNEPLFKNDIEYNVYAFERTVACNAD